MDENVEVVSSLPATIRDNFIQTDWRGLLNLRVLGFALARAWVYLMFIGAATSSVTWTGDLIPPRVFSISIVTLALVMFCAAIFSERLDTWMYQHDVRATGPALTCLGTLLAATIPLLGGPALIAGIVGAGILTGVGSGLIDLAWGEVYRNVPSRQTCLEAPLAFLLAAGVYFLCDSLTVPAVVCALAALFPIVSGLILFARFKVWSPSSAPAVKPVPVPISRFALRVGLCAALVGAADGAVRAVFMTASGTSAYDFYHLPMFLASVVTLVIIWGCVLAAREFNLRSVYKISMIIMAFFFQLLPIFVGMPLENVLALAGYGTFNVLIWILLADVTYRYRLSSLRVFGVGWSMLTIGVFLGSHVGQTLCDTIAPFSPRALSIIALAATIAVLLSYMFVLTDADLVKLTTLAEEQERERESRLAQRGEGNASGAEAPASDRAPRFVNRCKQIAEACGLTERETDIMILYAKGRSSARIQEDLHLSRGTITTHLRHVYMKMDVHNKQEFLDYIEGRRADGGA